MQTIGSVQPGGAEFGKPLTQYAVRVTASCKSSEARPRTGPATRRDPPYPFSALIASCTRASASARGSPGGTVSPTR